MSLLNVEPMAYTTVTSVLNQLNVASGSYTPLSASQNTLISDSTTGNIPYIKSLVYGVSDLLTADQNRVFLPIEMSIFLDSSYLVRSVRFDRGTPCIRLPYDLLSISSIQDNNGYVVDSSKYRLDVLQGYPVQYMYYSSPWESGITVDGVWGYNINPAKMWKAFSTLDANISSTSSTLVLDSGSSDILQYIKIGDEVMLVEDAADTTLTIDRAKLGTSGTAHTAGDTIYLYVPSQQVSQTVRRMVVKLFLNRGELSAVQVVGDNAYQILNEKFELHLGRWRANAV